MERFTYVRPRNLAEARKALSAGGTAKAGGFDLLDRMKEGVAKPDRVISLACGRSAGKEPILHGAGGVTLSAFATLAEVAGHAGLARSHAALARAAREAATPQVRNVATVGGNLLQDSRCWYYRIAEFSCAQTGGEGCPALTGENQLHAVLGFSACPSVHASNLATALLALDAVAVVDGGKRPIAALWPDEPAGGRFHALKAGEILERVEAPAPKASAYVEVRQRESFDWALASCAAVRKADGAWRIALGSVAPRPWRAAAAEGILGGTDPDAKRIAKAADAALEGARPLAKNAYKLKLARTVLIRAVTEAAGGGR